MWLCAQEKGDSPLDDDRLCCTGPAWKFSVKRKLEPDQVGKAPNRNSGYPCPFPFYCTRLFSPLRVLNMTVGLQKKLLNNVNLIATVQNCYIHGSCQYLELNTFMLVKKATKIVLLKALLHDDDNNNSVSHTLA